MQITPWLIYWIDVIHSICVLGNLMLGASFVLFIMSGPFGASLPEDKKPAVAKWILWMLCVGTFICIFVPSKTVMMQMLILPPVVNNEQVQQLPSNVLEYVNNWLEEANAELKEKKK